MANDTTTDAPPEEETDAVDEEVEAPPEAHTADSVPGAVTADTPEASKKSQKLEGAPPLGAGFMQLANDVSTDEEDDEAYVVPAGTKVSVVEAPLVVNPEGNQGIGRESYITPEDADIIVRTRDARGDILTVGLEDLEPLAPGRDKG